MKQQPARQIRQFSLIFSALALGLVAIGHAAPPIIQPGAPGEPSRQITAEQAVDLARVRYSAADVRFMSDMIPHHQQALDMSELVADRTGRNALIDLSRRIESSQKDEIEFMLGWLRDRGEPLPDRDWRPHVMPAAGGEHQHHGHHHHADHGMEGMATIEQMEELAASSGEAFDRLFLELMIEHHRGALVMVEELLAQDGSAQDPVLFEFTTEISNDQTTEIERMTVMLAGFSPDPRQGLAAGLFDAEQAIWNMELLSALPRPTGFHDPDNPAGLSDERLRALAGEEVDEEESDESARRGALLDFANTDMALAGDLLVAGSYHGFNLYELDQDGLPDLVSSVVCPGGQGDVSVVGDLLILSVEQFRGRLDCGLLGVAESVSPERFRGLRIFDISDRTAPVQVGAVQTCRGSHTHTVVSGPDEDGRIIVYNSGTAPVRDEEELAGCIDESPWRDDQTALFRIDVIEIPVERPQDARIIHSPAVFADPETGILAGLWERGDHGPGTQTSNETNHCHDITIFPELNLAAGACSGNGILFDISDPINPTRIDDVTDPGFAYWHSATFNNDGTKVIFTDEWGGGTRPRCRASDPLHWGANAIYDIVDNRLVFRSYYKMPAPQTEQENCVAHNGSLLPVPGRDIMVQAWYQGGISVFDFTDTANPIEIAYFDRGPIDEEELITGGYWSAYWYRGRVYGTEIVRGLDTLKMIPSDFLSANEIAAASLKLDDDVFNPQTQLAVRWPAHPVVARAYMDQLERGSHLEHNQHDLIEELLARFEQAGDQADERLAKALSAQATIVTELGQARSGMTRQRLLALAEILSSLAGRQD